MICGGGSGGATIGRAGGAAAVEDVMVVVCRKRFEVEVLKKILSEMETMEDGAIGVVETKFRVRFRLFIEVEANKNLQLPVTTRF